MKINIKATGIELTQAISDYVHKRIFSIEKYLDQKNNPDIVAQVEVGRSTRHHKAGNIFRAEIDIVKDEIVRNIVHLKGKRETLSRKGAGIMKNIMKGIISSFKKRK